MWSLIYVVSLRLKQLWDRFQLWVYVILSLLLYIVLALWFSLPDAYNIAPPVDVRYFAPSFAQGVLYGLMICALFLLLFLCYRTIHLRKNTPGLLTIAGVSCLFSVPLLLTYPINANDIYRYVIRGRISSIYGESPFSVAADAFADDPFASLAGEWAGATSPYGPVWELVAGGITAVTRDGLSDGLLSFKLLGATAFIATTIILWGISPKQVHECAAFIVLWAWNPALLLSFVANAHNDALMIFWLLLGYLAIRRGYPSGGLLLMFVGALTKPVGILALPFMFVAVWHDINRTKQRVRFIISTFVGALILTLLAFSPFGSPLDLAWRLFQEAAAGASFSLGALLVLWSRYAGFSLPLAVVSRTMLVALAALVLWLLWRTWRGRTPLRGTADVFLAYIVQALNFRIWYATWAFPWLLLDAMMVPHNSVSAFRLRYGLWFLLTSQLSVLIYGHIRVTVFAGDQLAAHLAGVIFTFFVPLLMAWITGSFGRAKNSGL